MGIVLGYRDCWCILNDSMNKFLLLLSVYLALWSSTSIHVANILSTCHFHPCHWALGCRETKKSMILTQPSEPLKTKCSNKTEQNKWQNHVRNAYVRRDTEWLILCVEEEVRDGDVWVFKDNYERSKQAERREQGIHTAEAGPANRERPGLVGHLWFQERGAVPVGVWELEAGGQIERTDQGWTIVGLVHSW